MKVAFIMMMNGCLEMKYGVGNGCLMNGRASGLHCNVVDEVCEVGYVMAGCRNAVTSG